MNSALSLPPDDDIDTSMRLVARNLAMDLYDLPKILEFCGIKAADFHNWKHHPRFLAYLKTETEAWNSANNTSERTKLKAGILMEEWMETAFVELRDRKQGLNHRVELGKLIAKIAGLGETSPAFGAAGGGGSGGFSLQINIAPGQSTTINARAVVEDAEFKAIPDEPKPMRTLRPRPSAIPDDEEMVDIIPPPLEPDPPLFEEEDDDYDPFQSPDTLGDYNA